jgi:acetyl-CoA acetyltransferase
MNLTLKDIGVVEFHEAFAGQVLANMTAMASEKVLYCILLH